MGNLCIVAIMTPARDSGNLRRRPMTVEAEEMQTNRFHR
jgi:hypothetical protein